MPIYSRNHLRLKFQTLLVVAEEVKVKPKDKINGKKEKSIKLIHIFHVNARSVNHRLRKVINLILSKLRTLIA
jgi:hypothetical protein